MALISTGTSRCATLAVTTGTAPASPPRPRPRVVELAADVSLEHAAAEIDTMRAAKIATTERITLGDSTEVEGWTPLLSGILAYVGRPFTACTYLYGCLIFFFLLLNVAGVLNVALAREISATPRTCVHDISQSPRVSCTGGGPPDSGPGATRAWIDVCVHA